MNSLLATHLATAVVLGGAFAVGVGVLVSLLPAWGAPTLSQRIAPYVRDITDPRGTTQWAPPPLLEAWPTWRTLQNRFAALLGGSATIERRLQQAAWRQDVAAFRGRQVGAAIGGLAVGGVLIVVLALTGRFSGGSVLLPPILAVLGAFGVDAWLARAARSRVARVEEELPTVLEFLSLCLSAGEGLFDSLRRVAQLGAGDLTAELRGVVLSVGTGSSLADALAAVGDRLQAAPLSRCIDHLIAAIDRGAPLAQVLHAQALDAREDAKRTLIEKSGRKEIFMLLPLVFLILPLSVLFAVFPGVFMLRLGIG